MFFTPEIGIKFKRLLLKNYKKNIYKLFPICFNIHKERNKPTF